jgi:DNA-binding transcriptional ArsR family regulator
MSPQKEKLVQIFKALGDANRLEIVLSIGNGARSVTEIIKATGVSQTLVSFHLRALREANIVTTKRSGPFIYYSLSNLGINEIVQKLAKGVTASGRGGELSGRARARSPKKRGDLVSVGDK